MSKKIKSPGSGKKAWAITGIVIAVIMVFFGVCSLIGFFGRKTNYKTMDNLEPIGTEIAAPTIDPDTGYWTFTVDRDLKVLQLTDVHFGAGAFCIRKDNWAMNAVYKMIKAEKPDLVIVTGDIAYPVPFQAGTINNKNAAKMFADLMEKLGVYWTFSFGNHDTEAYSLFTRKAIDQFYNDSDYKYCLYQSDSDAVDGYGNSVITIKNTEGMITQALITIDSHSYTGGDIFGIAWNYDNIHQNQVDWYADTITHLNDLNKMHFATLGPIQQAEYAASLGMTIEQFEQSSMIRSSAFFHIPLVEFYDAYHEYVDAGRTYTENVTYFDGKMGEKNDAIGCGKGTDNLFEKALELGSTKAFFFGHDHLNTCTLVYKGISMTYGMSIDYLAYPGIWQKTEQRGGTRLVFDQKGDVAITRISLNDVD